MKRAVLASIVAALVIASLGVGYYLNQTSSLSTPCCTTTVSQTTYTATNSELGIHLSLSLNATTIQPGGLIGFQAFVYNDFGRKNNVSASSDWSIPRLIMDPCSPVDSPVAVVTIPGHYDGANISSAPTPQFGIGCTTMAGGIMGYFFQAYSNMAYAIGGNQQCEPSPCVPMMDIGSTGTIVGYLSNGQLSPFVRGVYTIVVEDEWGDMALASFTVR